MRNLVPIVALTLLVAGPSLAQDDIGTITRGAYVCELPGDVRGAVGVPQPQESFTIESASRYSSAAGSGTYMRRGDVVTFTSGPRNGESFAIVGRDFLRRIEADGQPGRLRCVRQGG